MFKKIENYKKVKKELDYFETSIKSLEGKAKLRAENLFIKLRAILEEINVVHSSNYNGYLPMHVLKDKQLELIRIRQQITQIIKSN